MTQYLIRYMIIPPGVGPDDYEPADLETRNELVEVPGTSPTVEEIHTAVVARLAPGSGAAILAVRDPERQG
jgi:hypothetical protein